jgi:hypothetical protein
MLLWNDEGVSRGERTDVEKCEKITVFIELVCRNISLYDFAENAVIHV